MGTLSERLTKAMADANVNQADLARACGVKPPSVHGWLSGKSKYLRGENLLSAAAALGVNQQWLATGTGPIRAKDAQPLNLAENPDYPAIRRVSFRLSAGISGFAVEYLEDDAAPIVFQRTWFEKNDYRPECLFAVRVGNGSMEPGLWHGDTVVVNTAQTEPRDGLVFAVNYEGELVIKRLVRDAGRWWLASDNPDQSRYPRKVCDENAFIIGQIVHKQSEHI